MKVLFVCTGNICRSPTGEGVFRHMAAEAGLADRIETESCGMGGWHTGQAPDPRAIAAARERGYDISDIRARKIRTDDFRDFDLLLAMDRGHFDELTALAPSDIEDTRVRLFLEPVAEALGRIDVPDPYYGAEDGFKTVLDLIESGARGWLDQIQRKL